MPASPASSSRRRPLARRRRPTRTPTASGGTRSRHRRSIRPNSQVSTRPSLRATADRCPGPGSPTTRRRLPAAAALPHAEAMTTALITGPTRGLGRHATLAMADRGAELLLVGRPGPALTAVAGQARARGAGVTEVPCDLARLSDVRQSAATVRDLVATGAVGHLQAVVANAGAMSADTRRTSADGYELTFAVNYLAHAQLIAGLLPSLTAPARIVLLGSNTYHANFWRRLLHVPAAAWRDPIELARPAAGDR